MSGRVGNDSVVRFGFWQRVLFRADVRLRNASSTHLVIVRKSLKTH